jgi:hypothetical protein
MIEPAKKSVLDWDFFTAFVGSACAFVLNQWSEMMAGITVTATAGFTVIKFCRELQKSRRDKETLNHRKHHAK